MFSNMLFVDTVDTPWDSTLFTSVLLKDINFIDLTIINIGPCFSDGRRLIKDTNMSF